MRVGKQHRDRLIAMSLILEGPGQLLKGEQEFSSLSQGFEQRSSSDFVASPEELDLDVESPIGLGCSAIAADERQLVVGGRCRHERVVDAASTDAHPRKFTRQR